jgi:serine phosphatase RsbU (regulator of sigma subunit)
MDAIEVTEDVVHLSPGDALVLYTDGVTERRSGARMFGDHDLLPSLRTSAGASADVIARNLEQQVQRFGSGASRDDLAVLVIACPRQR